MIKALLDLYMATHALQLAFDEKANTQEVIKLFGLQRMQLEKVIDLAGRDQFIAEFRRWTRSLSTPDLK